MPVPSAGFSVVFAGVNLVTTTAKTVAGIAAGANRNVKITEIAFSADATSGNVLLELVYGTNATNVPGTNSTSFTPLTIRGTDTVESTAATAWSSEPTVLTVVKKWRLELPSGPLVIQFPLGREPSGVTASSTAGKFIGLRATSSVTVTNSDGHIEFEE